MTGSNDYRLYLQERFESMETLMTLQFTEIHRRLGEIETQVKKTNGTVQKHEAFNKEVQRVIDTRVTDCPHVDNIIGIKSEVDAIDKEVKKISEDLSEYRMLKKYPRLGILIVAIFVVGMYLGYRKIVTTQDELRNTVNMINTPVRTRDGVLQWYPSGVLIDSISKIQYNVEQNKKLVQK